MLASATSAASLASVPSASAASQCCTTTGTAASTKGAKRTPSALAQLPSACVYVRAPALAGGAARRASSSVRMSFSMRSPLRCTAMAAAHARGDLKQPGCARARHTQSGHVTVRRTS